MKDKQVFQAFVNVIQKADEADDISKVRDALYNLNDILRRRGYDENVTWHDALLRALS